MIKKVTKGLSRVIRWLCDLPSNAEMEHFIRKEILECSNHLKKNIIEQRRLIGGCTEPGKSEEKVAPPRVLDGLDATLKQIKELSPAAYALWLVCQQVGQHAYEGTPVDSCSVYGHRNAELFHGFLAPYLKGLVLDIGCGPQPVPEYLMNYPVDKIAGIDPIGSQEDHPFTFYKGLAESIPWDDNSFDTVIIGTSMDHFILLDRCLEEIKRVLKTDGKLLIWVSFCKGAPKYNPYQTTLTPFDKFVSVN